MSYARAGNWVGCVKSTVCQWLAKAPLAVPELPPDGTPELDGLWTRTHSGCTELRQSATLLREYRRNIGMAGFAAARRLLNAGSLAEGREWARRIMRATDGAARYWCEKALRKGLRHLATGQARHRTTSRLERHNRELRRREKLGRYGRNTTCWRCCQSRA